MLKQLRFKNWRSLRDVTIDLEPITVFIGANSSGKTNIINAFDFRRSISTQGLMESVLDWTLPQILSSNPIQRRRLELDFIFENKKMQFGEKTIIEFGERSTPFNYSSHLIKNGAVFSKPDFLEIPRQAELVPEIHKHTSKDKEEKAIIDDLFSQYRSRWQILDLFAEPRLVIPGTESGNRYILNKDGSNTLLLLETIESYPNIFSELLSDIEWLMPHIKNLQILRENEFQNLHLYIYEEQNRLAPTVSVGTYRLFAMMCAIYALDLPQYPIPFRHKNSSSRKKYLVDPSDPGIVLIDEPDIALNPGVLRNFVEILRRVTSNPEKPRQVILTTHNPTFLNYFEPHEVRVVERGEDGYSTVNKVPEYINDIWLKDGEYGLGEVWLGNSLGGMPK